MANYYPIGDITVFPSNNAVDAGKLTDESNLRHIPQRLTEFSYKLLSGDFTTDISGSDITITSGSANICGYDIVTTDSITISTSGFSDGVYNLGIQLVFVAGLVAGDDGTDCLGVNVDLFSDAELTTYTLIIGTVTIDSSVVSIVGNPNILYRLSATHVKVTITADGQDYDVETYLNSLPTRYISKTGNDTFGGTLVPDANNTYNIGSSAYKLQNIYSTTFIGNLTGTASKATGDANGDAIVDTYAKLAGINSFSAANTFTSNLILSGTGALVFGSYGITSAGVATLATSRILGLGINTAYDASYRLKVSGNSLFSGTSYFGTADFYINSSGNLVVNSGVSKTRITVGQDTLNTSYAVYVVGSGSFTGDLTAARVFNAQYNDIADFVKKDQKQTFEPGDIISVKRGSDEYVLADRLNSKLVVGVYSNTYGHVMGGENLPNMQDNLEKYIPVAIAGNVNVKVVGEIQVGDLITVSEVDGVGIKVMDTFNSIGCIVGKALESKKTSGIGKIKMQVMLA